MGPMEDEFDIGEEIEAQQEILILGMTFLGSHGIEPT